MAVPEDEPVRRATDARSSLEEAIEGLTRELRDRFAQLNARFDAQGNPPR
jgi:hypothetical protein